MPNVIRDVSGESGITDVERASGEHALVDGSVAIRAGTRVRCLSATPEKKDLPSRFGMFAGSRVGSDEEVAV
jgi:hypothetical protein